MRNKPKKIEMFYIDDAPDVSALFVARDKKNNIIAEYEHKRTSTIDATFKAYQKELNAKKQGSKEFWKMWDENVKKSHPKG